MISRLIQRFGTIFLLAALVAFALSRTATGVIDLDLFHEMALAREIVQSGAVPWTDSFAYTPTIEIVVHHEWGLGMIALAVSKVMGGAGIIVLKFALIFGLGYVVWSTARGRRASPIIAALFLALGIVLSDYGFATVRAQMFSYLFAGLLLAGFDRDRKGDRTWLWGVAVMFPIWGNLHGGCLVGAALFATHWFEQLVRRQPHWHLFFMGLALIPLAALNPWGFQFHVYLVHAILMPRPAIAEWSPLWDPANRIHVLYFGVSLLPLILILRRTGFRRLPGILIVVATALAAVKSHRFLAFYAVAYASYLPGAFSQTRLGRELRFIWWRQRTAICILLGIATLGLGLKSLMSEPWRLQVPSHPLPYQAQNVFYPVGAVDYLEEQQYQGNVMVPYDWGAYVMWRLGPAVKISMDSRYEVAYPPWRLDEDDQFYFARPGWQEILEKYPTDVVLVPGDFPIVKPLGVHPGWRRIYEDPQFVMFAKQASDLPLMKSDTPSPNGHFP
jgi:hypothetical protein